MLLVFHFVFKCFEKLLSKTFFSIFQPLKLGMAMGQVRARFLHTQTRPAAQTQSVY